MFIFNYLTGSSVQNENDFNTAQVLFKQLQKNEVEISDQLLQEIVAILRRNIRDRRIALLTTHMISNIALTPENATKLCQIDAIESIFVLLEVHQIDNRVIWKSASALWNLFTVGSSGSNISSRIPADAVERLMKCLERDCGEHATHTLIGALGNLVLILPQSFINTMTIESMRFLGNIAQLCKKDSIRAHYGALVANMASTEALAELCVQSGQVEVVITLFRDQDITSVEAMKHLSAALHNLSDVEGFAKHLCSCEGIEVLHQMIMRMEPEVTQLLDGIFNLSPLPREATTSLHAATVCCDVHVITKLMCSPNACVNERDMEGKTACDRAIQREMGGVVEIMVAAGAEWTVSMEEISNAMKMHLQNGMHHRHQSQKMMNSLISKNARLVNDMGGIVTSYIPGVDVLLVLQ